MFEKFEKIVERFNDLEKQLIDPNVSRDRNNFEKIAREHKELSVIVRTFHDWKKLKDILPNINDSNRFILGDKSYINTWNNNNKFWQDFKLIAPHLSRIDFAGGEPLIDPTHYKILELISPSINFECAALLQQRRNVNM